MKEKIYKINDQKIVAREIDDNMIILDVDTGEFISTSETGCFIMKNIIKEKSINEIYHLLIQNYNCINNDVVYRDLKEFVNDLIKREIII